MQEDGWMKLQLNGIMTLRTYGDTKRLEKQSDWSSKKSSNSYCNVWAMEGTEYGIPIYTVFGDYLSPTQRTVNYSLRFNFYDKVMSISDMIDVSVSREL